MRPRVLLVTALVAILLGGGMLVPAAYARLTGGGSHGSHAHGGDTPASPAPPPPPPPPTLRYAPVNVKVNGFFSWALLDRETGEIAGSTNMTATNSTESMVKVWLVSDFLRRTAAAGKQPTATQLKWARTAIIDSNDISAERLYSAGGRDAVIKRLIKTCGLTDSKVWGPPEDNYHDWWSYTQISAEDAVRMGECVKSGKAAGPKWTQWVLTEMSKVRGTTAAKDQRETSGGGRWGIIDGLPDEILAEGVSIKNGWTMINADQKWHVNCLAVHDDWVLAVLMRYPRKYGLKYGANACKNVARQLVFPPVTTPPSTGPSATPSPASVQG